MMRTLSILAIILLAVLGASCHRRGSASPSATPSSAARGLGCGHELKSNAVAMHSWPYPADQRDLRWVGAYQKMQLKLKPTSAAFVTATVTWKNGDIIPVEDSEVRITKPRRLVAKRALLVTRKVWDQGVEVERTYQAVARGEVGSFLFYNSRGMCMIGTDRGPAWTECTLDDAFEGLSDDNPDPCEQVWWVKVRKSKVDHGWMAVQPELMERRPSAAENGSAK